MIIWGIYSQGDGTFADGVPGAITGEYVSVCEGLGLGP